MILIKLLAWSPPVDCRTQRWDILTAKLYLLGSSLFWLSFHTLSYTHMRVALFKPSTDGRAAVISDLEKVPCWRGLMFESLGFARQRKNLSHSFFFCFFFFLLLSFIFSWKKVHLLTGSNTFQVFCKKRETMETVRAFRDSDMFGQSNRLYQIALG